jgi:hypothetical protein
VFSRHFSAILLHTGSKFGGCFSLPFFGNNSVKGVDSMMKKYYAALILICAIVTVLGISFAARGADGYVLYSKIAAEAQPLAPQEKSVPPAPSHAYILTARDGYIVVLHAHDRTEKEITPTPVNIFPPEEQERLAQGIYVYTEEALFRLLEDYGS